MQIGGECNGAEAESKLEYSDAGSHSTVLVPNRREGPDHARSCSTVGSLEFKCNEELRKYSKKRIGTHSPTAKFSYLSCLLFFQNFQLHLEMSSY